MPVGGEKEIYAKAVCLFLSEQLLTRKISLQRSAEIAQKVVDHLNLIDTEEDFLKLIKELASDFEELYKLGEIVSMNVHVSRRSAMEQKVREFVISIIPNDSKQALEILLEAVKDESDLNTLCGKFPSFKQFIQTNK